MSDWLCVSLAMATMLRMTSAITVLFSRLSSSSTCRRSSGFWMPLYVYQQIIRFSQARARCATVGELAAELNEPGKHGEGAVEPVEHDEPDGHGVHSAALLRLGALEYEPAGHGSSAPAPAPQ